MKRSVFLIIFLLFSVPGLLKAERKHIEVCNRLSEKPSEEIRESFSQFLVNPSAHPLFTHFLTSVSSLNDCVEIEDGSIWKIRTSDQPKINHWRYYHVLIITQNSSWFSSCQYKIINHSTGDTVEADLILGPFENEAHTHYITFIDYTRGELVLSNNTVWQAASSDVSTFRQWKIQDAIIIGQNTAKLSQSFPALLINVNTNNYTRANNL